MAFRGGGLGEPQWLWPDDTAGPREPDGAASYTGSDQKPGNVDHVGDDHPESSGSAPASAKRYPPRTCRICLETVNPTYHPFSESLPNFLQASGRVTYESEDPELGILIRPCKCKGSSRYVHEGCLQSWRHAGSAYGRRTYWQCPTCGFQYRLERMRWGRWISSTFSQLVLTIFILLITMFVLGFVADPIINLYVAPVDTIFFGQLWESDDAPLGPSSSHADSAATWSEHFLKGLASLGVLSFLKVLLAISPWQWWNLRNAGLVPGGRRATATTGRDRAASISWIVIVVGVAAFLWGVYKGVRAWSCRVLKKAGERVMDVPLDDDDDDENEEPGSTMPDMNENISKKNE